MSNRIIILASQINIVPQPEDIAAALDIEDPVDEEPLDNHIGGFGATIQSACDFMEEYGDIMKAPDGFLFVRREGKREWELMARDAAMAATGR